MKNFALLFSALLLSGAALASEGLSIETTCKVNLDYGIAVSKYKPIILSSEGKNSEYFNLLSRDSESGFMISLNKTSDVCEIADCANTTGSVYTLTLVRIANDVKAGLNMTTPKNAKGKTTAAVQITKKYDGSTVYAYMADEKIRFNEKVAPEAVSINYSVKTGTFSKQNINIECSLNL